ncbi:hypothetical protein RHGRI_024637 [Rhododendron griersonianum]|uniref:protein S-acyltransferase n=1 Tax=Rhododendron griersonianum TaxID=479676 RepID=A0AAV6JAD9_9ERIC|nr:hypothetical protein RHGRI_024637 [Rhododendron griersonianum]
MYEVPPPHQRADSATGTADATAASLRAYETWKGSNVFLLQGRFIVGPDASSLFFTIFLIAAPVAIFCVFVARKLMDISHHLGILITVVVVVLTLWGVVVLYDVVLYRITISADKIYMQDLVLLLMTSGRDPGIVPRNAHPPEPENYDGNAEVGTPQLRLPRVKDVLVNGITVKIKYCDTCMLYRPPRCSHCSICNNCVERIMDSERTSIWKAMIKTPASIALIIYTFIAVWFVGGLTVFHLYLISTNQSTYENFRYRYERRDNPYNRGVIGNFKEIFWTSIPPSKNKFRAKVPKEQEILSRTVSSSFSGPYMQKNMVDMETGRKPGWDNSAVNDNDLEGQFSSDEAKESEFDNASPAPDLSRNLLAESAEVRNTLLPRRSSWGRKSGSWDLPSEVLTISSQAGDSNRISGINGENLTGSSQ